MELHHERDDIKGFYSQFQGEVIIGIEACGYTNWFEELMEQLGHKLLVGDAAEIRRLARRRQKNDRRDADLLLDLLVHDEFPALFRYSTGESGSAAATALPAQAGEAAHDGGQHPACSGDQCWSQSAGQAVNQRRPPAIAGFATLSRSVSSNAMNY